jgi:2-polyprenyl-3-methyl-5-hydroxy-6-metoxy-1,4-benzoquinol methylase
LVSTQAGDASWYVDAARQRALTVDFAWAHDVAVGPLRVTGTTMGHRYLTLWAAYADVFGLPARLDGLDVLDVGAATGASSLLFAALGAARVAVPDATTGLGLPHQT